MSGKSILVTGGTGFIGSSLVKALVHAGHQVRVLDNQSRGASRRLKDIAGDFEFLEADIRDSDAVDKSCKGIDSVFHLAFVNGTEFFYTKPDLVLDVGVKGMVNVLDAAIKNSVSEFVLASSSEVYQTPPQIPTDESAPLIIPDVFNPRYSYAAGKMISEVMAINYGRKHFERTLLFRPHNVYGPDMGWEHVIPQFVLRLNQIIQDERNASPSKSRFDFPIQGSGEETRAFVYIDDFTAGLMAMFQKGKNQQIYHIGTQEELSVKRLVEVVAASFDVEVNIGTSAGAAGGTMRRCPDISKLAALGYKPTVKIEDGVQKTKDWYVANLDLAPAQDKKPPALQLTRVNK
ncbi:MAG: SDR family NAD(P)-dependent oxidoreductase [Candidatus Obscuribacterales bacterium]|nr:SDR family NAD(P)-dependent oxidoreductase [Candidatus Obscuribacterales bacterium]